MSSNGIKKIVVNLDALQMKAPKKQTKQTYKQPAQEKAIRQIGSKNNAFADMLKNL